MHTHPNDKDPIRDNSTETDHGAGQPTPKRWDAWHAVLGALAAGFAITCIWLWSEVSEEKSESRAQLSTSEQRAQSMLDGQRSRSQERLGEAREEAAQQQASALAAAIQPIMTFRGQVPEISDRSVQTATENLARQGNYSFVAITDATGKVVSSSDLTVIGQEFGGKLAEGVSTVDGQNQAVAPIGGDGSKMGFVVIRIRS